MQIFDMHIHAEDTPADPAGLLANLAKAGIYGACVFSHCPEEFILGKPGIPFEARMAELKAWTQGYEDRLFPVLWIHPYEKDIFDKIRIAAEAGVAAFKIICNDFFIYEEQPMAVLRAIAAAGKPVFFHSGILWDGQVSSAYNRPLNWEALLKIEGLRFSMGHCSWPWIDECVAMYGKFLNALSMGHAAEMFFDITPGTPEIYRRELLTKLYTLGYDVGDNVMFGTDMPILRMRCRRIEENGTYINLIPPGLYGDPEQDPHLREVSAQEAEKITFFAYEELLALKRAAETLNLSKADIEDILCNNAENLIADAKRSIYGE